MLPHLDHRDGCTRYAPGHHVHWIHAKKCVQEPGQAVELLLTSGDVHDDGRLALRAAFDHSGELPEVWTHAPTGLRELLAGHRGRVFWLPRWHALRFVGLDGRATGLVNVATERGPLCETVTPGTRRSDSGRGGLTRGL
ncbi:hypothetical protein ABZ371_24980 [Streptomyces sp. NPDC005899]|uniref:hypothetical protein n=1 Tax=Streptomyces sp. NPDC005899 TaxID=3155716 RepID=UPI0033EB2930